MAHSMAVITHPNVPVVFNWQENESGWGDEMNAALVALAATAQAIVETVGTNSPPGSPTAYYTYAVGSSPTGAWSGNPYTLAYHDGTTWKFIPAKVGWRVYSKSTTGFHVLTDTGWRLDRPKLLRHEPTGAAFAFTVDQAFGRVEPTNTNPITATLAAGVFAEGDEITIFQRAGQITFSGSGALDILLPDAKLAKTFGTNSAAALLFSHTSAGREKWFLLGDLAEE